MTEVDESPLNRHAFRELPFDKERRLRRRGLRPVVLVALVVAALWATWWWWPR